jgi:hypothetical protein
VPSCRTTDCHRGRSKACIASSRVCTDGFEDPKATAKAVLPSSMLKEQCG